MKGGFELCELFEKCRLAPYLDHKGIPTIGKGLTWYPGVYYPKGQSVSLNDPPLTQEQADRTYETSFDIHVELAIEAWSRIFWRCPDAFQNAYASFVYNTGHSLGIDGYPSLNNLITELLIRPNSATNGEILIDQHNLVRFADVFMLYDDDRFDDNVQNNSTGLSIRRYAECLMMLAGYSAIDCYQTAYRRGNDPNDPLDPTLISF